MPIDEATPLAHHLDLLERRERTDQHDRTRPPLARGVQIAWTPLERWA
jgi:hypothetical protein